MADPDLPNRAADLLEERIEAHRTVHQGFDMPKIHINSLSARFLAESLAKGGVEGLSPEADSHLRTHLVDEFDRHRTGMDAINQVRDELRERVSSGSDPYSLALVLNSLFAAEHQAVSDHYEGVMAGVDAADRAAVERHLSARIGSVAKATIDYAALSLEAPDYVLEQVRAVIDGPSELDRALGRALADEASSAASDAFDEYLE